MAGDLAFEVDEVAGDGCGRALLVGVDVLSGFAVDGSGDFDAVDLGDGTASGHDGVSVDVGAGGDVEGALVDFGEVVGDCTGGALLYALVACVVFEGSGGAGACGGGLGGDASGEVALMLPFVVASEHGLPCSLRCARQGRLLIVLAPAASSGRPR